MNNPPHTHIRATRETTLSSHKMGGPCVQEHTQTTQGKCRQHFPPKIHTQTTHKPLTSQLTTYTHTQHPPSLLVVRGARRARLVVYPALQPGQRVCLRLVARDCAPVVAVWCVYVCWRA